MTSSSPLVSVVIPAYNYAHYLDEAIRSVLEQDYPNLELIVLDDGSKDGTQKVLERYGDRFYWETQENMGEAATLTKGWRMARGEILAKLSADDVLLPGAASAAVRAFESNPHAVLAYPSFDMVGPDSRRIRRVDGLHLSYRDMVVKIMNPVGPGAFFKRNAYEVTGPWDSTLRLTLDYDFWLRLGLQGTFSKIPEVTALFRVHQASQSFAKTDEARSEEFIRVISNYFDRQQVPEEILVARNEALSNAYIFSARSHLRSRRYTKGVKRLFRGFYLHPANISRRAFRVLAHGLFNHIRYRRHVNRKRTRPDP